MKKTQIDTDLHGLTLFIIHFSVTSVSFLPPRPLVEDKCGGVAKKLCGKNEKQL